MDEIRKVLSFFDSELVTKILDVSKIVSIEKGTKILREGQYIKSIPIVIKGLIKVISVYDDKELLLYYIRPKESCIMSFAASIKNEPIYISAITEEDSEVLLIPSDKIARWITKYPKINQIFYQQYNQRYTDLINTINSVLFNNMDKRLYSYLKEKKQFTNKSLIKISHREIANDLGTAREVISRVMKKLENEGSVKQLPDGIKLL